jgi:hypothetical protein
MKKKRVIVIFGLFIILLSTLALAELSKTSGLYGYSSELCEDVTSLTLSPFLTAPNDFSGKNCAQGPKSFSFALGIGGTGCFIGLDEDSSSGDDDCVSGFAPFGSEVNNKYKKMSLNGVEYWEANSYGDTDKDAEPCYSRSLGSSVPYICAEDKNWYACSTSSIGEKIEFKDADKKVTTYYCLPDENDQPFWTKDLKDAVDTDEDGFPDFAELSCGSEFEVNQAPAWPVGCDITGKDEKNICTFKGIPEKCGDGIDNDCNGITDNCNNNPEICKDDGKDFIEGAGCCGATDGDLGEISQDKRFVCLNKIATTVDNSPANKLAKKCDGEWCWLDADSNPSKIITLKDYDIVSDSKEWNVCNQEGPLVSSSDYAPYKKNANRFYCYQKGNTYQYADCRPTDKATGSPENGIKERIAGDGAFTLPMADDVPAKQVDVNIKAFPVDFTGYNFLEFYAQFPEKPLTPAGIGVKINGPNNVPYLNVNAFTYTQNTPLIVEKRWYYFKMPLPPDLLNVQSISFNSETNKINVKSVHVTKDGENSVCSGQSSSTRSSWLTSLDEWEIGGDITGKEVCNTLFSTNEKQDNAWLQSKEGFKELPGKNRCCGNTKGEYYSGATEYGCWNSEPVAKNERVTNVEIEIEYNEELVELVEEKMKVTFTIQPYQEVVVYQCPKSENTFSLNGKCGYYPFCEEQVITTKALACANGNCPPDLCQSCTNSNGCPATDCVGSGKSAILNQDNWKLDSCNKKETIGGPIISDDYEIIKGKAPVKIYSIDIKKEWFFDEKIDLERSHIVRSGNHEVSVYFQNSKTKLKGATPENLNEKVSEGALLNSKNVKEDGTWDIMAVSKDPGKTTTTPSPKSETFTYTCFENTCEYPLPGKAPYTITNPHPSLYELSHKDKLGVITQITKETSVGEGNIIASKVAQQVVHTDGNFYSCEIELEEASKQPYCTNKGEFYCSYGQDGIINTWTTPKLDFFGYNLDSGEKKVGTVFPLKENVDPVILEQASNVLPGRNFLPNSEFNLQEHWFLSSGELSKQVEDNTFTLFADQTLTSERIPAPKNSEVYFSHNGTCSYNVIMGYNDQDPIIEFNPTYNLETGEAAYIQIEFTGGECTISKPMLQVVEEDEDPNEYENPSLNKRAGAACCPKNACWNGYACIQNMKDFTFLSEKTTKNFRCINGEWGASAIKKDWNEDQIGFCQKKEQCFVMPLEIDNNPACINETQYVFDHYCEEGNWTSRTKFLAGALLDSAPDEYTLYCTNPEDAFNSFSDKNRQLILGDPQTSTDEVKAAPGKETAPTSPVFTCLPKHPLIEDSENTCINNVCIIKTEDGTGFATTLNKNSFLETLNIDPKTLDDCKGEGFVKCGDVYYNSDLNAIAYGVDIEKGTLEEFFDNIAVFFKSFFKEQPDPKSFLEKGKNFNQIYLSNVNNLQVRAINEKISKTEKAAIIEYEGFNTPICDYVNEKAISAPTKKELLQKDFKVVCTTEDDITKVEAQVAEDFFFTNLTGKLRQPIE